MQPFQSNTNYLFDRTKETLGLLYQMHWPSRQYETARGVRRSPFHDRLLAQGEAMTEIVGYERPGFFAAKGRSTEFGYSYGKPSWFEDTRAECLNTASHVTVFDHSCFVKFRLGGNDALAVLNRVSANQCDVAVGKVVYTQWRNDWGRIEADVTITRLSETSFLIVTIAASQTSELPRVYRRAKLSENCPLWNRHQRRRLRSRIHLSCANARCGWRWNTAMSIKAKLQR